jgi:hypothetical protein
MKSALNIEIMNDYQNQNYQERQQARSWPKALLLIGAGFFVSGISAGQYLAVAAGFMALAVGGFWLWSLNQERDEAIRQELRRKYPDFKG